MALAVTMCFGFAVQNVNAAFCPPHKNTKTFSEPVSHWMTTHRVYRNMYEDDRTYEKHSLAGDPDYK